MTSDAKIGLLLGLVFIFVIAFVINGLPSFDVGANNNKLTTGMVGSQNNSQGLGVRERKVSRQVINPVKLFENRGFDKVQGPSTAGQTVRFQTPLPDTEVVKSAKETVEEKAIVSESPKSVAAERPVKKPKLNNRALSRFYVVSEGDNLAVIAKRFYGPQEGNKEINITRIFKANRRFLKSPDEIYVGQKLVIPPLLVALPGKNKNEDIFSTGGFTKVESIGRRRLPGAGQTKQSKWYTVRQGDSLWLIAADQLGDGSRYGEVAKLNSDILDDEDCLAVGVRLKMPVRY